MEGVRWSIQGPTPKKDEMRIHLHLKHEESGCGVSMELTEDQKKQVMQMVSDTEIIFSKRQDGIPVKMWVTGSLHSK